MKYPGLDRESSSAERIVAGLLIIKGFVFVVRFILPGCYPENPEQHWVVPSGCSRCAQLQSFPVADVSKIFLGKLLKQASLTLSLVLIRIERLFFSDQNTGAGR